MSNTILEIIQLDLTENDINAIFQPLFKFQHCIVESGRNWELKTPTPRTGNQDFQINCDNPHFTKISAYSKDSLLFSEATLDTTCLCTNLR